MTILLIDGAISWVQEGSSRPPFRPANPNVHDPVMAKDADTFNNVFRKGDGPGVMSSQDMVT